MVLALLLEALRQGMLMNFRYYRREILALIIDILFFLRSDIFLVLLLDLVSLGIQHRSGSRILAFRTGRDSLPGLLFFGGPGRSIL